MYLHSIAALLLAAAGVSLAPGIAHAKEQHMSLPDAFAKADKNHDGTLDRKEAKMLPRIAKNFDAIDKDKDGTVTLEEIRAAMSRGSSGCARAMPAVSTPAAAPSPARSSVAASYGRDSKPGRP